MKLSSPFAAALVATLTLVACGDDTSGSGGSSGTGGSGSGGDASASTTGSTTSPSSSTTTSSGDGGNPDTSGSGGDPTGSGGNPDTSGSGGTTGSGGAPSCDQSGFEPAAQDASPFAGTYFYVAQSTLDAPVDTLSFELLTGEGVVGARTVTDADYATCDPCVILRTQCDDALDNCEKQFLATTGTLDIQTFDATFSGVLSDAVLVEVTIDPDTFESTPVPDGETWCLDEYAFDAINQGNGG